MMRPTALQLTMATRRQDDAEPPPLSVDHGGSEMDADRFDRLLRSLVTVRSRRGISRFLIGSVVGSSLTPLALQSGLVAKQGHRHHKKKSCPPCKQKKNGKCRGAKPNDAACNGDGRCLNGVCNPKPTCSPAGGPCGLPPCCATGCIDILLPDMTIVPGFCPCSQPGQPCHETSHCCQPPSQPVARSCIGYVCQ